MMEAFPLQYQRVALISRYQASWKCNQRLQLKQWNALISLFQPISGL